MALKQRRVTRHIPQLVLRASVAPETLNEEKRTVDVTWTTGARVLRGFFDPYWEELSLDPKHVRMERLKNGAPLLDSHNGWSLDGVLGVVESAKLEAGRGVATVRFARDEDGEAVLAKVKDGIIRHISVGYQIHKMEKVEDGEGKVPVYRAVDWEPMELSVVPIAADAGSHVRSKTATTNPCEFIEERKMPKAKKKTNPQGAKPDTRAAEEAADDQVEGEEEDGEETETDGEGAEDEETEDGEETAGDGDTKERSLLVRAAEKRILGIQRIGRTLKVSDAVVTRAIDKGMSVTKFRAVAQREYEKTLIDIDPNRGADIKAGESDREKWQRGAQAWLLVRSATAGMVTEHAQKRGDTLKLDPGEFRGLSLLELARQSLERNGVRTRGLSKMELAGMALGMPGFAQRAGGYQTTSDFPVLLAGTLNRVLLAAYAIAPDTWRKIAKVGSVPDFRASTRVRMGTFGRLDKVLEHGEFTNKPIPDGAAETIAAETFGNIIAITRQALVNDDLGAFTDLAARLGRAAKLSIEIDLYALLALNGGLGPTMADGLTLFHATHANIGAGAALSVASLDADRVLMAKQLDMSGNDYLDIRPKILLVPSGLEMQAKVLMLSEFDPLDGTTPNGVRGLLEVQGSPRITGTRRYMFADPADLPVLEVVFVDGVQEPFLETREGWRIDGTEWKVRLDYGVDAIETKGAVTNAGV